MATMSVRRRFTAQGLALAAARRGRAGEEPVQVLPARVVPRDPLALEEPGPASEDRPVLGDGGGGEVAVDEQVGPVLDP